MDSLKGCPSVEVFNFEQIKSSHLEKMREALRMSMITGELLTFTYRGGATPGKLRDISPLSFVQFFQHVRSICHLRKKIRQFSMMKLKFLESVRYPAYPDVKTLKEWDHLLLTSQRLPGLPMLVKDKEIIIYASKKDTIGLMQIVESKKKFLVITESFTHEFKSGHEAILYAEFKLSHLSTEIVKQKKKAA